MSSHRASRHRLRKTLLLALPVTGTAVAVRGWARTWGSTTAERRAILPGDGLLHGASLVATRAISVDAPPAAVWSWVVQLGQGRAGFYSYDTLENLLGCDIHSAPSVVDAWQDLQVGDTVGLYPGFGLDVVQVEAGRAMVLRGAVPMGPIPPPYDFTWAFVVRDGPAASSRLVVRERYRYVRGWAPLLVEPVGLASLLMSRRMLIGIRDRAEGRPRGVAH